MQATIESTKLTNIQLELLKLFALNVPDADLLYIKRFLAQYFAQKATEEVDKLWEEKAWTEETMRQWSHEHMRIPYQSMRDKLEDQQSNPKE